MMYRNLMAMDVEETIRANPIDAVVLLGGCDKTVPAQLMGAASAGVPAIALTGGPMGASSFRGAPLASGSDLWRYTDELRAGLMSEKEYGELELALIPTSGHCMEMGTASTMASVTEALGMTLPGTAAIPAAHARRAVAAERTGRRAVDLARAGFTPRDVLTREAFENAITVLMALGGSTNAVLHLLAIAGRVGVDLPLETLDEVSRRTPRIVDVKPAGRLLFEDVDRAGGIPAVMHALGGLVHLDALTVTGATVGRNIADASVRDHDVIRPPEEPLSSEGGIAVLRGSLAPRGAIIKQGAMSPELRVHEGPALVFDDVYDLLRRIDDPDLNVTPSSVLVLKGAGPGGRFGMPEWGQLPIPRRLLEAGVRDMVRISDARISGTASGAVVVHVTPDSSVDGPLRALRTGDTISLDVERRRLDVGVPPEEIERRLAQARDSEALPRRGYRALYHAHVLQADKGCDFDFLRDEVGEAEAVQPDGLFEGWLTGW
jgi:dihydroxy-acid dehydratase